MNKKFFYFFIFYFFIFLKLCFSSDLIDAEKIINVKTYGAQGDGISDDLFAFNSAINDLPSVGGMIFVPTGTYNFGSGTLILKKGVRLIGESKHSTYIINRGGNTNVLITTLSGGGGYQEIANLQFQTKNFNDICVQIKGVERFYIHDNVFYSPNSGTGLHIQIDRDNKPGAYTHTISNNISIGSRIGIELKGGITSTKILNNHIISDEAIYLSNADNLAEAYNGGNVYAFNLLQSRTGNRNSPAGNGIDLSSKTTGELILGNYIENYDSGILIRKGAMQHAIISQHWDNNRKNIYDLNSGANGASIIDLSNNFISLGYSGIHPYGSFVIKGNATELPLGLRLTDTQTNGGQWSLLNGHSAAGEFTLRDDDSGINAFRVSANNDIFLYGNLSINNTEARIISGKGSPEGIVIANVGSIYLRTDGSLKRTFYVKETGNGNTGWVAK